MPALTTNKLIKLICLALFAATFLVYSRALHYPFIDYDDSDYPKNAHVQSGLTTSNIVWAFTSTEAANWHPLTWISHMMDCQLFGLNAGGHHFTNILIHSANTVLLFLLLNLLTGAIWRSAFVAAIFGLHPLHVESVVWISERKDVLCAFFWMLTLIAYAQFVNLSKAQNQKSKIFYALAFLFFACGLMSKPMIVTLPFVLLLLDVWPLQRFSIPTIQRLLLEKLPFFALTIVSCIITARVQHGAMWSSSNLPFQFRFENALLSYLRYISKIFWPTDLALIYPYPHSWPIFGPIAAGLLLVLLSVIFLTQIKQFPYLAVGWFWFLGTLVPTIGLVQVGVQAMADRYSYLPSIGISILVAWGASDLLNRWPEQKRFLPFAAGIALAACAMLTTIQLNYWRSSVAIFGHTIKVTTDNYAAYDAFGKALENIGQTKEAADFYSTAVQLQPDFPAAQFDLGMALIDLKKDDEASNHLAAAVQLSPNNPVMQFDYGIFLAQHGNPEAAAEHFKAALAVKPNFPEAQAQLDLLAKTNSSALDIKK